jgi:hypothetical protein
VNKVDAEDKKSEHFVNIETKEGNEENTKKPNVPKLKLGGVKEPANPELTPNSHFDVESDSKGYMTQRQPEKPKEKIEMVKPKKATSKDTNTSKTVVKRTFGLKKKSVQPSTKSLNKSMRMPKPTQAQTKSKNYQSFIGGGNADLAKGKEESRPQSTLKPRTDKNKLNQSMAVKKPGLVNPELSKLIESDEDDDRSESVSNSVKNSFQLKMKGKL